MDKHVKTKRQDKVKMIEFKLTINYIMMIIFKEWNFNCLIIELQSPLSVLMPVMHK